VEAIVAGAVAGTIPDHQLAAWLMAVTCRDLSPVETSALTWALVASGDTFALGRLGQATVDDHSIGGVRDRVSLIACPLAAALGVRVPKLCGRGLANGGDILDKLESLPGVSVDLEREHFLRQVEDVGIAIGAWPERMVPADRVLGALREVTGTVPSVPLVAGSVMARKLAAGVAGSVLEISFGPGSLLPDLEAAHALAVRTAVEVLEGGGDPELRDVAVTMALEMRALGGILGDPAAALDSGAALDRFWALVEAQGGRRGMMPAPAPEAAVVTATEDGWVQAVDTLHVHSAVLVLQGGRHLAGAPIDHGVGVRLEAVPGAEVRLGDPLCRVHARSPSSAAALDPALRAAWTLGPEPPTLGPRMRGRLTSTPFPRA
jgi:thymidine phosphorylase